MLSFYNRNVPPQIRVPPSVGGETGYALPPQRATGPEDICSGTAETPLAPPSSATGRDRTSGPSASYTSLFEIEPGWRGGLRDTAQEISGIRSAPQDSSSRDTKHRQSSTAPALSTRFPDTARGVAHSTCG